MQEWFKKTGGYWTFGIFLLALLGAMGGVGVWGLSAQDDTQTARGGEVSTKAESEIKRIEDKMTSEVKRVDGRVDTNLVLIRDINTKLNRIDGKLDTLLTRVTAKQ